MIEKHYSAHIKTALDTKAIDIRRERYWPAKQQTEVARRTKAKTGQPYAKGAA